MKNISTDGMVKMDLKSYVWVNQTLLGMEEQKKKTENKI